jgi:hypothetical protein
MPETLLRLNSALSDRYRIERELGAGGMATVNGTHRAYAVTPDGTRFAFMRFTGQEAAGPANVVLVEHWFTELDAQPRR